MTQSIITRYHDYSLSAEENHKNAAHHAARALAWRGQWQGAALNDKGDMVWVNCTDSFAKNYQFKA